MDNSASLSTSEDIRIKDQMGKMVGSYDKYMNRATFGREDILRNTTIDLAKVKAGDSVLEIGCATGSLSMAAARKAGSSGKVCAIDLIPGMIEAAKEKSKRAGLDIDFQTGSIEKIPYAERMFDRVLCSFMIFHMSVGVRNKGFEEIFRVLKPGGTLLILDIAIPRGAFARAILKFLLGFMLKHDLEELNPKLESAGFSEIRIARAPFRVFGLPLISYLSAVK